MTGFGRGIADNDAARVTVEITSVNSKRQQDVRFILPREVAGLEPALRPQLQEAVARGSVQVALSYELKPAFVEQQVAINEILAKHVVKRLKKIATDNELQTNLTIQDVLTVPGIISENIEAPLEKLQEAAAAALAQAISELRNMQAAEGEKLCEDLSVRQQNLTRLLEKMRNSSSGLVASQRDQLFERVQKLGLDIDIDDERLAKEVVFYAERSDITEECVRLESHLNQMLEMLSGKEPVGRALEFLCQEFNREITTILSKTGNAELADTALLFKIELSKIREQVQNVE